jgi:hypothetical protein
VEIRKTLSSADLNHREFVLCKDILWAMEDNGLVIFLTLPFLLLVVDERAISLLVVKFQYGGKGKEESVL